MAIPACVEEPVRAMQAVFSSRTIIATMIAPTPTNMENGFTPHGSWLIANSYSLVGASILEYGNDYENGTTQAGPEPLRERGSTRRPSK